MEPTLAAQAAAPPDTVVTIALRDGYDVLLAFAAGATLATMIGALLFIAFLLVQTRRAAEGLRSVRERIAADPAIESLRSAAANVDSVSRLVQGEVERLSQSVAQLSDRLGQASDRIEERIDDLSAFVEVVQSEAEEAFVNSAATARGVRAGLGSLARRDPPADYAAGEDPLEADDFPEEPPEGR